MCDTKKIDDILCCPACKGGLEKEENYFSCQKCRLRYQVKNGIYNFLIDEAEKF